LKKENHLKYAQDSQGRFHNQADDQ
jgi:hypothetical protein